MSQQTTVRGLRRAELITNDPEKAVVFHRKLLRWTVLQTESGFDCWVGDRCTAMVRKPLAHEPTGWRPLFAGGAQDSSLTGPDDTTAGLLSGRAQHGPWAPEPRLGEPCWIELFASDGSRADNFWTDTLSWTTTADGSRVTYRADGRPVANRSAVSDHPGHEGWLCYFAVADIGETSDLVCQLGGSVLARFEHPVAGAAALITDPDGATCAVAAKESWGS